MKVGFIGFGKSVHRYHASFITEVEEFELVGYYKRSDHKFEMQHPKLSSLKRFATVTDLIEAVDVVIICTHLNSHFEYAKLALENNCHVLVEKPMCKTLDEAKQLYQIASDNKLKLVPYQNRRFDSDFLDMCDALDNYNLGKVGIIESVHSQYRPDYINNQGGVYDGMIYGHAVHFIDQIISRFGRPDDVQYQISNMLDLVLDGISNCETYYDITLIYDKLRIKVEYNPLAIKEPPRWTIYAENGTFVKYGIDQQERDLKLGIFTDNPRFGQDFDDQIGIVYYKDQEPQLVKHNSKLTYAAFYNKLYNYFIGKGPAPVTSEEACLVIEIMETIVKGRQYIK